MFAVISTAAIGLSAASNAENYPATVRFDNGITAILYSSEYIMENMVHPDDFGGLVFYPPGRAGYPLITDTDDPAVVNKGDGEFHPVGEEAVIDAVEGISMRSVSLQIEIEIFFLPLPRRYIPTSSSCGNMIFLSPGVYEVTDEFAAFTVTHEIGHAVQNRFLPESDERSWDRYLSIRGILDDPEFSDTAVHMYRPQEVFAEDFRYFFGSGLSNISGTIENPELPLPDEVRGLERFFLTLVSSGLASSGDTELPGRIVSASNYPNPFNPSTVINCRFADHSIGSKAEIRIYDVNGRLVRNLFSGTITDPELSVPWDGRCDSGAKTGSGIYFYTIRSGADVRTGKMLIIR